MSTILQLRTTCPICRGTGLFPLISQDPETGEVTPFINPHACEGCGGLGYAVAGALDITGIISRFSNITTKLSDMDDKLTDIQNKCNDIFERLTEGD